MQLNEFDLIQGLQTGEESAFRLLVETYQKPVYNTVLNILQDEHEAEDAAQEVFIKVYQSISRFRGDSALSTWIYRISVHVALDKCRRRKSRVKFSQLKNWFGAGDKEPEVTGHYHPGIRLENKEKAARLFKAIDALPENQRIVFTLLKVQGLSYEEVCQIMNKKLKAVESLMSRAKLNLQQKLEHYDPGT